MGLRREERGRGEQDRRERAGRIGVGRGALGRLVRPLMPLALLLAAAGTMLLATGAAQAGAQTLIPRPAPAPEYSLGAGDQLTIHVINMDEISDKPMRLDPNGYIDIPLAGRFKASGMTVEQFKEELARRLSRYVNNPQISVSLTDNQSRNVSVIDEVKNPGVHDLPGPKRLIEVLSLAGGVTENAGARVLITREQKWGPIPLSTNHVDPATGESTAWVNLDDLMELRNPSANIVVMPNDVVAVPRAEMIYVVGGVKKAGAFALTNHDTLSLMEAVTLAQGIDKGAAAKQARILREAPGGDGGRIQIPVNINDVFAGKSRDVALQANDILYVPTSSAGTYTQLAVSAILQAATTLAIYRF